LDDNTIIAVVPENKKVHGSMLAQIAQQILEIEGIKVAFVLGNNSSGNSACSARSDGDFNVQVVMEKVGGGGHFNAAATQSKDLSLEELENAVIEA
jgi:c-di-AMP phosphodiesterase-like protein